MRIISSPLLAAAACFFSAMPAHAQQLGGGQSPEVSSWRILLTLLLGLILACVAIGWLHKRKFGNHGGKALRSWPERNLIFSRAVTREIEIIEQRRLNSQSDICLLRCQGTDYLILLAADGAVLLKESPSKLVGHGSSNASDLESGQQ